jgi:hypothetical protein
MGLFNRKPKGDEEAEPQGARQPAHDRAVPPQTFVPTALSVHADLLPREFIEERQDAKVLRLAGIGVAGLLAIGLLASLGTGAVAFSSNRALGQEQDRAAQLAQEKTKYADASSIAGQISDQQSAQTIALFAETNWKRVTDEFNASLPGGANVSTLTLDEKLAPGASSSTSSSTNENTDPLVTPFVIQVSYEVKSGNYLASADLIDALAAHVTGFQRATTPTITYDTSARQYTATGTVSIDVAAVGTDRAQAIDESTRQQLLDQLAKAAEDPSNTASGGK